jgi:PIN domain nuclease of toxin-antitoxin system
MWAKSVLLPWEHRDPADRVIVALAQDLDATIITADDEIAKFYKRCLGK